MSRIMNVSKFGCSASQRQHLRKPLSGERQPSDVPSSAGVGTASGLVNLNGEMTAAFDAWQPPVQPAIVPPPPIAGGAAVALAAADASLRLTPEAPAAPPRLVPLWEQSAPAAQVSRSLHRVPRDGRTERAEQHEDLS